MADGGAGRTHPAGEGTISVLRILGWWAADYAYAGFWQVRSFFGRDQADDFTTGDRAPLVVLVPAGALVILSIFAVSLSSLSFDFRGNRTRLGRRRNRLAGTGDRTTTTLQTVGAPSADAAGR